MPRITKSLLLLAVLAGSALPQSAPPKPGFNLYSKDQDIQLGRQAAQQVMQQADVVRNRQLQSYVQRIGQRLAQSPEAGGYPYEFTLINEPSINAFALPGGPVFIQTGLIAAADNEAQVAGVLAHEISHVALRHSTNQASKANMLSLPAAIAGAILGRSNSAAGQLGQLGVGLGANLLMLRYSRDAESQADALGARLLARAGYNPVEMARFFEKLERQGGGSRSPQFLSSHPNPGNRERAIEQMLPQLPRSNYVVNSPEFPRMQAMVRNLPAPRRAGSNQSSVYEADRSVSNVQFRQWQGSRFAVAYPSGWQVFGDQDSSGLVIAPRQGLVRGRSGNPDVAYGATMGYFFPEQSRSMADATYELIHHLHAQNPDLQAEGNSRATRIDGSQATITPLVASSPMGGLERNYLVTVDRPEGLFYMVFTAPQQAESQLTPVFDEMIRSLRFRR